ncbi:probable leucine-rich repeat receptor-like protein kinase At5g49770 [Punica granatum]|uniref:non-specific serine/threonine protein kinase n=2 Tax=Punica granatum TaxID=22663 RepID=A0A2I0L2K6_PUNGR|nr:probable leucine-rich repeat receptor-like protein kinase At5g49770 [Punica granatum]PKI74947.1 hypothetical protein CRG98_004719 [Punica granatum]
MDLRFLGLLLAVLLGLSTGKAASEDSVALQAMKAYLNNTPPNWVGSDPCSDKWDGIICTNSRVTSITLSSMGLSGQLTGDIGTLSELRTLDLSYNKGLTGSLPDAIGNLKKLTNLILVGCGFTGIIPDTIGSLQELVFLSLNSNSFSGPIPPSIGNLTKLYWLDLADNQLTGTIPVSNGSTSGLDMLLHTKHFHFGQNQLSGTIPPEIFSSGMKLIHVLFDNNQLTGSLPSTLGLVQPLEVVRFDRNSLSGPLPQNLNNLTKVQELLLSKNKFTGPLPNLTGLNSLSYLDMSNNSFDALDFPDWITTLQSLTTLMMEQTQIQGSVPSSLFSLANLQTVILRNNALNGTLNIGSTFSSQLQLVDLQTNFIDSYTQNSGGYSNELILVGNPICQQSGVAAASFCTILQSNSSSYSTPPNNCNPMDCSIVNQTSSPNCKCSFPYTGTIVFRAASFSSLGNSTHYTSLVSSMMSAFQSYQLPVDSIALSNPHKDSLGYLKMSLEIFPLEGDSFNRTGVYSIGFVLSNQTYKPPSGFGPFFFMADQYERFSAQVPQEPKKSSSSASTGVIVGATVGGLVLLLLLGLAGIYAFRQKKIAKKATETSNLFGAWDSTKSSGSAPQLKGARWFSFEDLKKCTNNFSESNDIGSGGYGKVYRGTLPTGQLVAIKRATQGSMQGGVEFKNEIELLSRVHHKNLVGLVGFCFEQGEQILVYEFIPNGTVKESLSGKSGIRLDWIRRLRVALGAARGIQYLHELANPPIIHRDIKSNNILLDERLNAKVGDFGLCKLMGTDEKGHVTTQVKGTMGYLDPEYYMTQQLTEKSDVYSFGVFCLELITARRPIERGKYIVREFRTAMDRTKEMYGLRGILDPALVSLAIPLRGIEKFVEMAMSCVAELGSDRPTMGEVVKEIENLMQSAGMNPNAESASTSASYGDDSRGNLRHPYMDDLSFDYSGVFPPSRVEPL